MNLKDLLFINRLTKEGTHKTNGWTDSVYGASKIGVAQMAVIHQSQIDAQNQNVLINAVGLFVLHFYILISTIFIL